MLPADLLPDVAHIVDATTRGELAAGLIADERDYVSSFARGMRDSWRRLGARANVINLVLQRRVEQLIGCDTMVAVGDATSWKILFLEAKYPRANNATSYRWDYRVKKSKASHFAGQLFRQQRVRLSSAVYEMIIDDSPLGYASAGWTPWGCRLISHQDALKTDRTLQKGALWRTADLLAAMSRSPSLSLRHVFDELVKCRNGIRSGAPFRLSDVLSPEFEREASFAIDLESLLSPEGAQMLRRTALALGVNHLLVLGDIRLPE